MGLYKKIMVAIDNSEESWHALKEALTIIKNKDTWAVIVTVAPQYTGDLGLILNDVYEKLIRPYQNLLERAKDLLQKERVLSKFILEEGEPYEKIVDLIYVENCDLVIMGRTGSGLKRLLLGSTAARVIGYSPVDVLIIPFRGSVNWKKILVPMDQSSYAERAFFKALELSKLYNGEIYLLSVIDLPVEAIAEAPQLYERAAEKFKKYLQEMVDKASSQGIKCEAYVEAGDPAEKILALAEDKEIGIIAMGSYGKTGLKRVLMGSVTEKVISLGDKPVLVVKN